VYSKKDAYPFAHNSPQPHKTKKEQLSSCVCFWCCRERALKKAHGDESALLLWRLGWQVDDFLTAAERRALRAMNLRLKRAAGQGQPILNPVRTNPTMPQPSSTTHLSCPSLNLFARATLLRHMLGASPCCVTLLRHMLGGRARQRAPDDYQRRGQRGSLSSGLGYPTRHGRRPRSHRPSPSQGTPRERRERKKKSKKESQSEH